MEDLRIGETIKSSLRTLKSNPRLALPAVLSVITIFSLLTGYLYLIGAIEPLRELSKLDEDFENQKLDYLKNPRNLGDSSYGIELLKYLSKGEEDSPYQDEFASYAEARGFDFARIGNLITLENLLILIIFLIAMSLAGLFFKSMSYVYIADHLTGSKSADNKAHPGSDEEKTSPNMFLRSLWFSFEYLLLKAAELFLLTGPLLAIILLAGVLALIAPAAGPIIPLLIIMVLLFGYLPYLLYLSIRLLFADPLLFLEKKGPVESIRESFASTKKSLKYSALILLLFLIMQSVTKRYVMDQQDGFFYSTVMAYSPFDTVSLGLITLFLILLYSGMTTFLRIFLFRSYIGFRDRFCIPAASAQLPAAGTTEAYARDTKPEAAAGTTGAYARDTKPEDAAEPAETYAQGTKPEATAGTTEKDSMKDDEATYKGATEKET